MTNNQRYLQEHEALEGAFKDLSTRAHAGEWQDLDQVWDEFAHQLERQLELEECELFERYPADDRDRSEAATSIRRDHAKIRAIADELGIQIQTHQIRADAVDNFVALLRSHHLGDRRGALLRVAAASAA